ncbi:MAG: hypothetical protein H6765_03145 [Candidatus Peribacteria bacterium]|nr:MAG: hypothetical protein H6765_03145 [Candidatus Peribacteria bacterium]
MLRNITHKRLFYISFFVFLGMRYTLAASEVLSFDFFKVRTLDQNIKIGDQYTQQSLVDDAIIGTVIAQISFGESTYSSDKYVHDALRLYEVSQTLVGVDILEMITNAPDPELALNAHIKQVNATIEEIQQTHAGLQELADTYQQEANACLISKRAGDKLFFDGTSEQDQ